MAAWKEMRLNVAEYLAQVRHPALSLEQQGRLALAWPAIYLAGSGSEDEWRRALGYTQMEWGEVRERYEMALPGWSLPMLTAEYGRQAKASAQQSENVKHRYPTNGNGRIPPYTDVYPASAVASTASDSEESKPTPSSLRSESENGVSTTKRRKTPTTKNGIDKDWVQAFMDFFWEDYLKIGRECSRAAALKAWMAIPHSEPQAAFDRLDIAFKKSQKLWADEKKELKYIPHAATWLNDYHRNLLLDEGLAQ